MNKFGFSLDLHYLCSQIKKDYGKKQETITAP